MKGIIEQAQSGRVKMVTDMTTVACASEHDAFLLFTLLDNTAYDVLPGRADAYPVLRQEEVYHSNGLPL